MASSVSTGIFNKLFFTYMTIAVIVGGLVIGWLFYSMWRFRARPGDARPRDAPVPGMIPAERGHVLWVYVMAGAIAAIMFGLAFSTISAVNTLEHPPEEGVPVSHHDVTGFQFGWRFNYTGAGGVPFNKVGEFTVPEDTAIVLNVTSTDVWHNFALPDYRIRVDAIPGEVNSMWFQANDPAETHVACVQICGAGHAIMRANLHVLTRADYDAWLAKESEAEYKRLERGNAVANLTLRAGGDAEFQPAAKPTREGGFAIHVVNQDAVARTVRAGAHAVTVEPGREAWLFSYGATAGATAPYEVS